MKKNLKIILIILGVIVGIILLDTFQAIIFKRSPIISKQEKLSEENHVDKGILMNVYYCLGNNDTLYISGHQKNDKYNCPKIDTKDSEIHTFIGLVVETHDNYLIVEPDIYEEERNSSDKFHITKSENDKTKYKVGSTVKITYKGWINESYPAGIDTIKIELVDSYDFELVFHENSNNKRKQIMDKTKYNYNVYICNGSMNITINNKTYSLESAIKNNKISISEIIDKAKKDFPNAISYDDGGSMEYHYDNYTIVKLNKLHGYNHDIYIGNKDFTIHDID